MFFEKFRIRRSENKEKENPAVAFVIHICLYSGVFIILTASIFMIIYLQKADNIVRICLPFIVAGVSLCYLSLILTWIFKKQNG
jgi:uncharacterized membrane protein